MQAHVTELWLWLTIGIISTIFNHSGYAFPWSSRNVNDHDYHHEAFNYNYGAIGLLDRVHGTYKVRPLSTDNKSN